MRAFGGFQRRLNAFETLNFSLFSVTHQRKNIKDEFCAVLFVNLSLTKPADFFSVRALSGKMYTFLLSALSRKMSSFNRSYPFSLRIKQKIQKDEF